METKNAENWTKEGNDWFGQEDYTKAIECYEKAIALAPEYKQAYCNMAVVYDYLQDYNKAIAYFQKAIRLKPNDTDARIYHDMGITHGNISDYDKAIECYQKAIEIGRASCRERV